MSSVESCRVELLGDEPRSVTGPTPVNAPYLSSELADRLLDDLPPHLPGSTVRFTYCIDEAVFTFSWELRVLLVARLARLGARLEFCIDDDGPNFDLLEVRSTEAELEVWTDDGNPDELSLRLGTKPSERFRKGDLLDGTRVVHRGSWRLQRTTTSPDLGALTTSLCDALPAHTAEVLRDRDACVRLIFSLGRLQGGFALEAAAVQKLAALGVPLSCWFYPTA
jgi:hypothetical protein